jgi:HPt (histidine-containing phosphotransfer) domain-containing protein
MQTTSMINLAHLRLFTMGDVETEKMMLEEIVSELKAESTKLPALVAAQDWQMLARVTHKLKTTLPFIGNQELIDLNQQVEDASRSGQNLEQIPGLSKQFLGLLPEVVQELEGLVK